jgi:hypothetical protein
MKGPIASEEEKSGRAVDRTYSFQRMQRDLKNPRWMYLKAALFLLIGLIACTVILLESPQLKTAALLAVAIWAFCRAYYFAFYVIEHYVDPSFKFAGLGAFVRYLISRERM